MSLSTVLLYRPVRLDNSAKLVLSSVRASRIDKALSTAPTPPSSLIGSPVEASCCQSLHGALARDASHRTEGASVLPRGRHLIELSYAERNNGVAWHGATWCDQNQVNERAAASPFRPLDRWHFESAVDRCL